MNDVAIEVRNLHKAFGATKALAGLDLVVERGQVMGFLGPNGSGKSTAIRVLMGLLRHDSGEVGLLGGDPWKDAVQLHRRVAYVPGDVSLWPTLTGGWRPTCLAYTDVGISGGCRCAMRCASASAGNGRRSWTR